MNTGDFQQCVKEYGELIAPVSRRTPSRTTTARSVCRNCETCARRSTKCGGPCKSCRNARRSAANLAIYADYAGDFRRRGAGSQSASRSRPISRRLPWPSRSWDRASWPKRPRPYQKLGNDRAPVARPGRRQDSATSRCTKGVSRMPRGCSSRARRRTWRPRTPTGPPGSSRSLAYAHLMRGQKARRPRPPRRRCRTATPSPIRFLAARDLVEANAVARARTIAAGLSAELPAEPQAYGKIIEGRNRPEDRGRTSGDQDSDGSQRCPGHLVGALRSRARVPGAQGVSAGRLGVRALHQAARRGAVAARGRGADVRLFPDRCTTTRAWCAKD